MASRNILKGWFGTRKKPTAAQFADWLDSYFHLTEDSLDQSKVSGLTEAFNDVWTAINNISGGGENNVVELNGAAAFNCVAGKVYEKFVFAHQDAEDGRLITITDGADMIGSVEFQSGRAVLYQDVSFTTNTTIYFNNLLSNTNTKIRIGI